MELSVALPAGAAGGAGAGARAAQALRLEEVFTALSLVLPAQGSPSPSACSESSGIGSLASLKSDSLPSSPHNPDKKLFEEPVVSPKPQPTPIEPEVKVFYGGRDILNLNFTLRDPQWHYRPARLPQNSPALFFANRSQYHRLGPFGTRAHYTTDTCAKCDFQAVVAVKEME